MSGVWYDGQWYDNTGHVCRRCGKPVYESDSKEYTFQCFHHDEDLYSFEADEATAPPRIIVARPFDGVLINSALEYLLDDNDQLLVFNNQPEAEAHLLSHGIPGEDLQFLHFIDYDGVPEEEPEPLEKLKEALKSGAVKIIEVFEELNYRDMSGQRWNDSLYEYATEELEQIEGAALEYVDGASVERVFAAVQEMEQRLGGKNRRTADDIKACYVDDHIVQVYFDECHMFKEREETPPDFEDFLLDFIEQNIKHE